MASASVPILPYNPPVSPSGPSSPRNFSKPFTAVSPQVAVRLNEEENAPIYYGSWPFAEEFHPLRRKGSLLDLASSGGMQMYGTPTGEATLARFPAEDTTTTGMLQPSTPQLQSPTSPSLASTITTLQSTPSQSPTFQSAAPYQRWEGEELAYVASKRKFIPLRQAKRLPRRASGTWCVYAAVIEQGPEAVEQQAEQTRGRSVRFAGISSIDSSIGAEALHEQKAPTTDSTYTLSKFKFPEPPGHTWTETFGESSSLLGR
jgi:hypothetical protein